MVLILKPAKFKGSIASEWEELGTAIADRGSEAAAKSLVGSSLRTGRGWQRDTLILLKDMLQAAGSKWHSWGGKGGRRKEGVCLRTGKCVSGGGRRKTQLSSLLQCRPTMEKKLFDLVCQGKRKKGDRGRENAESGDRRYGPGDHECLGKNSAKSPRKSMKRGILKLNQTLSGKERDPWFRMKGVERRAKRAAVAGQASHC